MYFGYVGLIVINIYFTVVISNLGYHGIEAVFIIAEVKEKNIIRDCDVDL